MRIDAHKGRWSDACLDSGEIWLSAAVTFTSWLTMIRSNRATGRDVWKLLGVCTNR